MAAGIIKLSADDKKLEKINEIFDKVKEEIAKF